MVNAHAAAAARSSCSARSGVEPGHRFPVVTDAARYTPPVHILFVCTANICRSPMAAALFAAQTEGSLATVTVSSAGIHTGGRMPTSVPDPLLAVMDTYGIDLRGHHSRALTADMLQGADLIVGMARRHVQEAVLLDPPCWPTAFMLKELIRRGELVGPRRPGQGIGPWIDEVHGDRTRQSLAGRSTADEVTDPYGGTLEEYRSTAAELTVLTAGLINLLWPEGPDRPTARGSAPDR